MNDRREAQRQGERRYKKTFKARLKQRLRYSRHVAKRLGYKPVVATYDDLVFAYEDQAGCCLLCGRWGGDKGESLHLDHDHETGRFRGFLCHNCNRGIGYLGDDYALLGRAAKYLKDFA